MRRHALPFVAVLAVKAGAATSIPSCPTTLVDFHPSQERNRSCVTVRRGGVAEGFWWTERSLAEIFDPLDGFYPDETFFSLAGKKVLDAGCGRGNLVVDLHEPRPTLPARGPLPDRSLPGPVDALGVDLYLSPAQAALPYFHQGDLEHLGFADETFDVVLATWTVFSYRIPEENFRVLRELRRVTKRGGRLHLGPLSPGDALNYASHVSGLRLVRLPGFDLVNGGPGFSSAEFERR